MPLPTRHDRTDMSAPESSSGTEEAEPKKRGRKPLPPEMKSKRGRQKIIHQEMQERRMAGAPPLQISFLCDEGASGDTASRARSSLTPFTDSFASMSSLLGAHEAPNETNGPNEPKQPKQHRKKGSMALEESDDDEVAEVRSRPRVDVSSLNGEKCIEILGAHTTRTQWPSRSEVSCWNCTFPFEGVPISIPSRVDKSNGRLSGCYGVFCSFNCSKRYCISSSRNSCWSHMQLLSLLYKKILGSTVRIPPAHPFQALRRFGGYMDIEEYRKDSITLPPEPHMFDTASRRDTVSLLQQNCLPLFQFVHHRHIQQMTTDSIQEKALRTEGYERTKPLPGSQNLTNTMGIVRH